MPPSNGTRQRTNNQQLIELQMLWQGVSSQQQLAPAVAAPAASTARNQLANLQLLWQQPGGDTSSQLSVASAGPVNPATLASTTDALIAKLKQGRDNG